MGSYVIRRILVAFPTLLGATGIAFLLLHLAPGDPIDVLSANFNGEIPPEVLDQMRSYYGLDKSLPVQFFTYLGGVLHGDLGMSITQKRPVTEVIFQALPFTLQLALFGMIVAIVVGISLGVVAALRHNTWVDSASIGISLFFLSMPGFWLAMASVVFFAVRLGWFPSSGNYGFSSLVLPGCVLGVRGAASIARLTRSSMIEVMREHYITTARAKGLAEILVYLRHALKNAFIPVLTMIGLMFGYMLGDAVVVETVFNRQGIGSLMLNSILQHDYPTMQGTALFIAFSYITINLLVDLAYAGLNPRIRDSKRVMAGR